MCRATSDCASPRWPNYSHQRGTDRLIEVAEFWRGANAATCCSCFLRHDGVDDVECRESWARWRTPYGRLPDLAARSGVADMFCFLGHVPEPERVRAPRRAETNRRARPTP